MKRSREEQDQGEGERLDDGVLAADEAGPTKVARVEQQPHSPSEVLGLESVGDDVLMMIMDLCGLETSLRAFVLANKHLHSLVRRHKSLWRSAYVSLFADPKDVCPQEDYFQAYTKEMSTWCGQHEFDEDDVPLGETDGELTIKVDFFGHATWEGHGVGCGRAGEYFSLNCLKGEGRLVLRRKKKELGFGAFVEGYESSRNDSCERDCDDDDEDDDDDDEDDEEDDEDDDEGEDEYEATDDMDTESKKKREEKERKRQEREQQREEKRKLRREERKREREAENSITESNWSKWVDDTLASLGPPYESKVMYQLTRTGCKGGSACQSWQEDMEW